MNNSRIAQSVEQVTVNHPVAGSIPAPGAKNCIVSSSVERRVYTANVGGSIPSRCTKKFASLTQSVRVPS